MGDSDIYAYKQGQKVNNGYRRYQRQQEEQQLFTNSLLLKNIVDRWDTKSPNFKKEKTDRTPDRMAVSMRDDSL